MRIPSLPFLLILVAIPAAAQVEPVPPSPRSLHEVEVPPRLANAAEVEAALEQARPEHLRMAGAGDTVFVKFIVDTDGTTRGMRLESARDSASGPPTLRAMSAARYSPALVQGQPVQVIVQQPVIWSGSGADSTGAPSVQIGDPMGLYGIGSVDMFPSLRNLPEVSRGMSANAPPELEGMREPRVDVMAKFMVDTTGAVRHVAVVESPYPWLVEPTRRAVALMRFRPAMIAGDRPVAVWITLPVTWQGH